MTYSNGINLENLSEIIQKSQDEKSANILKSITDKFMKKMMDNIMENVDKKKEKKKPEKKIEKKKVLKKNEIKCLECSSNKNQIDNNIFNSVDRDLLNQLLILPNNYGFDVENEKISNI